MQHPTALLELQGLLAERNSHSDPKQQEAIDERIRARFQRPLAVLISDMSGFSRITEQRGIIHFLALIQRMHTLCVPQIEECGGRLVKAEADNLFAVFPDSRQALMAAIAMRAACAKDAADRVPDSRISLAIGIGYGPILDIDGHDFFGDEVNRASKLGEDIAETGEILLTPAAAQGLPPEHLEPARQRISNIDLAYFRVTDSTLETA
ncbi:MAG: adenylate/guanylate cyclase domain-containing protein [Myxococcota bacterium]|nr:adenylate/guanylate cyclase domain-containing protein [Myxococcota bacterium]